MSADLDEDLYTRVGGVVDEFSEGLRPGKALVEFGSPKVVGFSNARVDVLLGAQINAQGWCWGVCTTVVAHRLERWLGGSRTGRQAYSVKRRLLNE